MLVLQVYFEPQQIHKLQMIFIFQDCPEPGEWIN